MAQTLKQTFSDRFDQKVFDAVCSRSLVYNTCWEDPAVDRLVLDIGPSDRMLVITSAGCNVLDYALLGPSRIHAVDANPRQNALLELKLAGIRRLEFDDFFALFGLGHHPGFERLYRTSLRADLSAFAREFWDKRIRWFENPRQGFYFHGLSGTVARTFHGYLRFRPRLAAGIADLFAARSLEDQRHVYDTRVEPLIWTKAVNWTLSRQVTMSMLGVPHPQRKEVQRQHTYGVAGFIRESVEYVFRQLPLWTNYFWMLYVQGHYAEHCCPEYLKADNFERLKQGGADCISLHTETVSEFLLSHDAQISKYVLLDHMDWMSSYHPAALREEWDLILRRARADARIIFRSAHASPAYLDTLEIGPERARLRDLVRFQPELTARLQPLDRVHTYSGFHVADVAA
ncbi:MAG: BtaA family protein [Thiohalocapsa sp.]|nr:BtaA family protein [Thiohalocapsa sp.]